jgi:CRP-like cAMP-binding protein
MDEAAVVRRAAAASKIALLTRCHLFADVREGALDQLAGEAVFQDVTAGTDVVREGDPADALYVVDSGTFGAWQAVEDGTQRALTDVSSGGVFGEIGLLANVPRTATVTARTAGRLLRVDGPAFLTALTQNTASAALLDGASVRLRRTHPQLVIPPTVPAPDAGTSS